MAGRSRRQCLAVTARALGAYGDKYASPSRNPPAYSEMFRGRRLPLPAAGPLLPPSGSPVEAPSPTPLLLLCPGSSVAPSPSAAAPTPPPAPPLPSCPTELLLLPLLLLSAPLPWPLVTHAGPPPASCMKPASQKSGSTTVRSRGTCGHQTSNTHPTWCPRRQHACPQLHAVLRHAILRYERVLDRVFATGNACSECIVGNRHARCVLSTAQHSRRRHVSDLQL